MVVPLCRFLSVLLIYMGNDASKEDCYLLGKKGFFTNRSE